MLNLLLLFDVWLGPNRTHGITWLVSNRMHGITHGFLNGQGRFRTFLVDIVGIAYAFAFNLCQKEGMASHGCWRWSEVSEVFSLLFWFDTLKFAFPLSFAPLHFALFSIPSYYSIPFLDSFGRTFALSQVCRWKLTDFVTFGRMSPAASA